MERPQPQREPLDADARQGTVEAVQRLVGLRREGRSGEAHALLVEAAYWPAARFPLLAAELQRAGLGADWATLLWEAASLPADRLVGAADALVAAGRTADGEQILRQGVARPAAEIGAAVLALAAEGRRREIRALLDAYVRVRTPKKPPAVSPPTRSSWFRSCWRPRRARRTSVTGTWCMPCGWRASARERSAGRARAADPHIDTPPRPFRGARPGYPAQRVTHRRVKQDRLRGLTTMVLARLLRRLTFIPLRPCLRA